MGWPHRFALLTISWIARTTVRQERAKAKKGSKKPGKKDRAASKEFLETLLAA